MITEKTYKIPSNLNDYCGDHNSPFEWLARPFFFSGEDAWAGATNGKGLIAYKFPIKGFKTKEAYLVKPDRHILTIKSYVEFDKTSTKKYNLSCLKDYLDKASLTCNKCDEAGELKCLTCKGSTEIECSACRGRGSSPCITCRKPDACATCEGEGVVECKNCTAGKQKCKCDTKDFAILVSNDIKMAIDLRILKKYLGGIKNDCFIRLIKNQIYLWTDQIVVTVMCVFADYPDFNIIDIEQFLI